MSDNHRTTTMQAIFGNMGLMKRFMHGQYQRGGTKLSLSQLELLATVHHNQPLSSKALADRLSLTPGAISQLLEGLVANDLVVRTPSPTDRRVHYVTLSRNGKRTLDQLQKLREAMFTKAFSVLNDDELETYQQLQQKLIDWFETNSIHTKQTERK